jgi:hypothetical protein
MSRRSENRMVRCYHGCNDDYDILTLQKPRKCPGIECSRWNIIFFLHNLFKFDVVVMLAIFIMFRLLPFNCWKAYHRCGVAGCVCSCSECQMKSSTNIIYYFLISLFMLLLLLFYCCSSKCGE